MAENWGFAPYSGAKNAKNGGFLRVCGRKTVGGAIKIPFLGVGNTKNRPSGRCLCLVHWARFGVFVCAAAVGIRYARGRVHYAIPCGI